MKTLNDFKPGDKVMFKTQQYSCETKNYTPLNVLATVTEIMEHGVLIDPVPGKPRPHQIHVGSGCLDTLEVLENIDNIVPFKRKLSK